MRVETWPAITLLLGLGACSEPPSEPPAKQPAVQAAPQAAPEQAPDPAPPKPVAAALARAAAPGEPVAAVDDAERFPGAGEAFATAIEFRDQSTGKLLPGEILLWEVLFDTLHPGSPREVTIEPWVVDPAGARITCKSMAACSYSFGRMGVHGSPTIMVECGIYVPPPGGTLRLDFPLATLKLRLLDSRGYAMVEQAELEGQLPVPPSLRSKGVTALRVKAIGTADMDGNITVAGLVPGRYLVRYQGEERAINGGWRAATITRSVLLKPSGSYLEIDPRKDPNFARMLEKYRADEKKAK